MDVLRYLTGLFAVALAAGSACTSWPGASNSWPRQQRAVEGTSVAYVDDTSCAGCHQGAYAAWSGSHHDLAMQEATAETVLGDFNDTAFTHFGVTSRFFQRDGRFFVNTEGPDGAPADFELTYAFGVEPLQQYLAPFPGGRLQSLSIAWDTERNQWFHLYPDERIEPDDPLHWTGRYQNWNLQCAACHSTDLRKNYDADTDTYETTWAQIDVGCQACHGPGASHVDLAGTAEEGSNPPEGWGLVSPLSSQSPPSGDDQNTEVETCAPCHSRREPLTPVAAHGGTLLDDYLPARLREGLYHPDGQILDEVYVYGSFVQSKMHAAGVRCSNCHDPHTLGLRAAGNGLCTQCHRDTAVERFPTLQPGSFDTAEHHHHDAGSAGAQCVNCHMPAQTYMVVDPRRDHSFRVPRPDLSMTLGTPNACTGCHDDRDNSWAAETVVGWMATVPAPHFAQTIAAGRAGDRSSQGDLAALAGDPGQPAIVRATALELLRGFGQIGLSAARSALTDDDPLVRTTAVGGLEPLGLPARRAALEPLLDDPVRAVRIEAARVLAEVWAPTGDAGANPALAAAAAEYLDALTAVADMPAGHLSLGVVHQRQGAPDRAEADYRDALALDRWFTPARFNLANLLNGQQRNPEAEAVLREGLEYAPDEGELHYSLGLLLAEENRVDESVESLGRAAALTGRARVRYNYGLALQQVGRVEEAETALREARAVDAADPDIVLALARLLMDQRRWAEARAFALELVRLVPTAPGPQRLLNELQVLERRAR